MKNIRKEIKTSYSISWESFLELERASKLCGLSIPDMIKIVMARYVKKMHKQLITEDNVLSYNKHGEKGYKRVYVRLGAKEYNIILQLKYNTRYTTSYMLTEAIKEVLGKIVMALLYRKKYNKQFSDQFYQKLIVKLDRFYIFWPNIEINPKILPFFQMHLDDFFY